MPFELITGPMYCGKTSELKRRIDIEMAIERNIRLYKPSIDKRYSIDHISAHSGGKLKALPVESIEDIIKDLDDKVEVIGIDEIQFLFGNVLDFCRSYQRNPKVRLIASGLNLDFRGESFPLRDGTRHMGDLMPYARLTPLMAKCIYQTNGKRCGKDAEFSQRLIDGKPAPYDSPLVLVGSMEHYEARCDEHHLVPRR